MNLDDINLDDVTREELAEEAPPEAAVKKKLMIKKRIGPRIKNTKDKKEKKKAKAAAAAAIAAMGGKRGLYKKGRFVSLFESCILIPVMYFEVHISVMVAYKIKYHQEISALKSCTYFCYAN